MFRSPFFRKTFFINPKSKILCLFLEGRFRFGPSLIEGLRHFWTDRENSFCIVKGRLPLGPNLIWRKNTTHKFFLVSYFIPLKISFKSRYGVISKKVFTKYIGIYIYPGKFVDISILNFNFMVILSSYLLDSRLQQHFH